MSVSITRSEHGNLSDAFKPTNHHHFRQTRLTLTRGTHHKTEKTNKTRAAHLGRQVRWDAPTKTSRISKDVCVPYTPRTLRLPKRAYAWPAIASCAAVPLWHLRRHPSSVETAGTPPTPGRENKTRHTRGRQAAVDNNLYRAV